MLQPLGLGCELVNPATSSADYFSASALPTSMPAVVQRPVHSTSSLCQWRPGRELFFWRSCSCHALNHQVFCRMDPDLVVNASDVFLHGPAAECELVGDLCPCKPKQQKAQDIGLTGSEAISCGGLKAHSRRAFVISCAKFSVMPEEKPLSRERSGCFSEKKDDRAISLRRDFSTSMR